MNNTETQWTEHETKHIPAWKVGPRIWRVNKRWRLRMYRPWNNSRLVEVEAEQFLLALYILGVGTGWWKNILGK